MLFVPLETGEQQDPVFGQEHFLTPRAVERHNVLAGVSPAGGDFIRGCFGNPVFGLSSAVPATPVTLTIGLLAAQVRMKIARSWANFWA